MKKAREEGLQHLDRLKTWIAAHREFDIIDLFASLHPADIADLIDNLEEDEKTLLFSLLDIEKASDVIVELSDISREQIIEDLSNEKLAEIIDEMDSDDAADIIAELPDEQAKAVLEEIEPEESEDVKKLLTYEEDTAGGIMQSELVSVRSDGTVNDALHAIAESSEEIDHVFHVFVVDEHHRLIGTVPVQKLITSRRTDPILSAIDETIPAVRVSLDQEEVARLFKKYDLVAVPVVNGGDQLLGRITIDDVVDVLEEESSEDLFRIAGLDEDDSVFNNPIESVKKRLPWLYINLVTALVSALIIGLFEDTLRIMVTLAIFMPLVAGLGGNAGGQTLTLIVRGLALGEVTFLNARKALATQVLVGLINGVAVGVVIGLIAYLWKGIPILGLCLGLAMIINIFVGTLIGTLIPLTLKWLKADPALGSNIFVTVFTDACGFFAFLGLATLFLKLFT